ncbi:MAG: hypothetical protein ABIQ53_07445, partial [Terracoccus sp.]
VSTTAGGPVRSYPAPVTHQGPQALATRGQQPAEQGRREFVTQHVDRLWGPVEPSGCDVFADGSEHLVDPRHRSLGIDPGVERHNHLTEVPTRIGILEVVFAKFQAGSLMQGYVCLFLRAHCAPLGGGPRRG